MALLHQRRRRSEFAHCSHRPQSWRWQAQQLAPALGGLVAGALPAWPRVPPLVLAPVLLLAKLLLVLLVFLLLLLLLLVFLLVVLLLVLLQVLVVLLLLLVAPLPQDLQLAVAAALAVQLSPARRQMQRLQQRPHEAQWLSVSGCPRWPLSLLVQQPPLAAHSALVGQPWFGPHLDRASARWRWWKKQRPWSRVPAAAFAEAAGEIPAAAALSGKPTELRAGGLWCRHSRHGLSLWLMSRPLLARFARALPALHRLQPCPQAWHPRRGAREPPAGLLRRHPS